MLGLLLAAVLRADDSGVTPAPAATPVHITDGQDSVTSGWLSPEAEAKGRANALYAEALLLPDGIESEQREVLDKLRQVIALDSQCADAQVRIARLLLQLGQVASALDGLKAAATANPGSVAIETTLSYAQHLNGQEDEAVRSSRQVLAKDPTQSTAMRVLLEVSAEHGDLLGGLQQIEAVLKGNPARETASAWMTLARLYRELNRTAAQPVTGSALAKVLLPIFEQAAAVPAPDKEALNALADTYSDLGRKRDALDALQKARALDPSNVDLLLRCGGLESDLGRKSRALKDYEAAYALNPGLSGLREMLGQLYLEDQRFEDASRLLGEALADSPQNAALGIDLGIALEGAHQPDKAQACFLKVFAATSCPPEAYLKLAGFQLSREELKQASSTLAAAKVRYPRSARIRYYEAIQHRYEKNYDAALTCLDQVRDLASGEEASILNPDFYIQSALILNLVGKEDRVEPVLREGLARYQDDADLMNELAYFWAERGTHLSEALALSRRASALQPDNGPMQDTQGWIYFQMGEAKDALPYLQRAALLTNNDPVVLQHVGDAYLKLGLRSEAIATWRQALEKAPRNGDLASRIDAALAQAKNAHPRAATTP